MIGRLVASTLSTSFVLPVPDTLRDGPWNLAIRPRRNTPAADALLRPEAA
ncbi:MAG: hypothetical protein ACHQZQ_01560 [SAR324 cluster bacterium]